ncbi:ketoacyl-ACP synthase III [Brevibacillus fluminis]|uniref:ketoacyl-ACP synthase III n=1 Tax=Brevibacillus fluminis TaxID=511487 RepID=UPI003F8CA04F
MQSLARITAIGSHVPAGVMTNDDLAALVDTNDEWIVQRTGIRERRIARPEEFTSHLAIAAVADLAQRYDKDLTDVDMILVCTTTPDYAFPSVASMVQAHFEMKRAGALDLNATCAGFVYGLQVAGGLITSGMHRKILVIGAETLSKTTNYEDRSTCILFGDGAGALLMERDDNHGGFLAAINKADGAGGKHVYRTGLSATMGDLAMEGNGKIVQNGREVYKWAVSTVPVGMNEVVEQAGVSLAAVDWFIPHSANMRIVESICERTGFPVEKTLTSMEFFGNTSSASIPLALDLGVKQNKVQPGDLILLYGFGSGLVQAGSLIRWQ